jgi:hypothetical protein
MAITTMRQASDTTFEPLPADIYYMKVRAAEITISSFKDKDGNDQEQIKLTWEVSRLTAEQEADGIDGDKWVSQWLSLYYGDTKNGPSKLKAFIDGLQAQGLLADFDPATGEIDTDWFIGIEQRVTLAVKGQYNNVVMVSPLKAKKPAAPAKAPAPAARNTPRHIEQAPVGNHRAPVASDDDDLFEDAA